MKRSEAIGVMEWLFGRNIWKVAVGIAVAIASAMALRSVYALWGLRIMMFIGTVTVLVWQFKRTRDRGFLWISIPLVIWPLVGFPLGLWNHTIIERLGEGKEVNFFPYSLVSSGQMSLGVLIILGTYLAKACKWSLIFLALTRFYRGSNPKGQ